MSELPKKDPKRVAAGKRGAEAKKIKAELKRKEEELLKKENIELKITKDEANQKALHEQRESPHEELTRKENRMSEANTEPKQITKEDNEHTTHTSQNYFQLPIITIVVVAGLGYLVYNYTNNTMNNGKKEQVRNELPNKEVPKEEVHVKKIKPPPVKKEIDPFEFN